MDGMLDDDVSISEIYKLAAQLPEPVSVFAVDLAMFEIFEAKKMWEEGWLSDALHRLVLVARRSYRKYGDVPITDAYDDKAAVFLCRATYPFVFPGLAKPIPVAEWLSVRFIPSDGEPVSTEDLDQYRYQNKSVGEWLLEKGEKWAITISRLCGIPRYPLEPDENEAVVLPTTLAYSALAFILVNQAFFSCYPNLRHGFITAVFREELARKFLNITREEKQWSFGFPNSSEFLGCTPDEVGLRRELLAYRFPGYFLDIIKTFTLLKQLVEEKLLSAESLAVYLKRWNPGMETNEWSYAESLEQSEGLGDLLTLEGPIAGSAFSGEELRLRVDAAVPDGPQLRIMPIEAWRNQIENFLAEAGIAPLEKVV